MPRTLRGLAAALLATTTVVVVAPTAAEAAPTVYRNGTATAQLERTNPSPGEIRWSGSVTETEPGRCVVLQVTGVIIIGPLPLPGMPGGSKPQELARQCGPGTTSVDVTMAAGPYLYFASLVVAA